LAQKAETRFKEKLRPKLEAIPYSWWLKVSLSWIAGIPDYLGVVSGQFVALELKRSAKAKARPLQVHILSVIERAGGIALVVFPENHLVILEQLKNITPKEPRRKVAKKSESPRG
jgi:hypothetical protein